MKKLTFLLTLFLIICSAFTSYAGEMIPGTLFSLKDGSSFTCSVEYSSGQGRIEATNPQTGEKFTGKYTVILVNDMMGRGKGYIIGDKGTVIFLNMEFSKGSAWVYPVVYGDGEDNNGVKYQYQTNPK